MRWDGSLGPERGSITLTSSSGAAQPSTLSDVEQIGSNNQATTGQTLNSGSYNISYVYQGSGGTGTAASNAQASVTQIGGNGSAALSLVQQNDQYQSATVSQTAANGGGQISTVTQSNYSNSATANQTTASGTDGQASEITQSGQYGVVSVTQSGPGDQSTVNQTGSYNNAGWTGSSTAAGLVTGGVNVNQSGYATNTSIVNQANNYSGILVTQDGFGGLNSSTVNQNTGQWDTAGVYQSAGAGISNTSTVNQSGSGANFASVRQH
jgi:hypothetical protein